METKTINEETVLAQNLSQEIELLKQKQEIEFALSPQGRELQLIKARQDAEFNLTPVGQELQRFETNQRMGKMYATSTIVPDTYKGNIANCAIACDVALRMNANALMVMQNLYMVHGNPSWSSKFLIATINTCGRFQPLRYECNNEEGDKYGWRCYTYAADDKKKSERLDGPWVTWAMVKGEAWDKKNGSKWKSMPEQMFRYRAAAFWQRLYAPEISMGFNTVEESQDMIEDVAYTEIDPQDNLVRHHQPLHTNSSDPRERIAAMARQRAKEAMTKDSDLEETTAKETPSESIKEAIDYSTGEINEITDVDLSSMSDEEYQRLMDSMDEHTEDYNNFDN